MARESSPPGTSWLGGPSGSLPARSGPPISCEPSEPLAWLLPLDQLYSPCKNSSELARTTTSAPEFPAYLRQCYIEDAHRGVIPYELWPHIIDLAERLARGESLIILKARQLGISWLIAAYARWLAQYRPGSLVLELSQGQAEAYELLDKSRRLVAPSVGAETDRQGELAYQGGGRIIALPATEKAGRGYTATCVIADEAAYHPYAAANYAAYRPTLDGGGQLIVVSTANGAAGWFYDMYRSAEAGRVPLVPVFLPWHARPGRDASWLERERAAFDGLPAQFGQEYPDSPDDAFTAHSGLVYGVDESGVRLFSPQNVRDPETEWRECRWRIVGYDPGGDDPSGLIALGVDRADRMHVYGIRRLHGAQTLESVADAISRWPDTDAVVVDAPPQSVTVSTLRALGVPAYAANKDKLFGIGLVAAALRRRDLTISHGLTELEQEFASYWWRVRKPGATGEGKLATHAGPGHHADLLDALRYAVVEAVKGSWREAGRVEVEARRRRSDAVRVRMGDAVIPGWDTRGRAREGQYR